MLGIVNNEPNISLTCSKISLQYPQGIKSEERQMPKMILTDASIRQLKSHKTRREIHDANSSGLYLFIQPKPSNAKSFAMVVTRPNGKLGKIYLGPFEKSQRTKPRERNPEIGDDL